MKMKKTGKLYLDFKKKYNEIETIRALFKGIFNKINSGIVIYEAVDCGNDFIIKEFNKAAERIEKIKKRDLLGKSVKEVFPGVQEFGLFEVFKRVYKTGKPEHYPISLYKDYRISGWRENYIFKLPSGEIVAVYEDLTKQKKSEEKLKINEKKIRDIIENINDWVWEMDETGTFTYTNPKVKKVLGYKPSEIIGKKIYYFSTKDEVENILNNSLSSIRARKPIENFVHKAVDKNKKEIILETRANPIFDVNGNFKGYRGISNNILERIRYEEKLKESEEKYRSLFERSIDGIYESTVEGKYIDANPALVKMLGYDNKKELMGIDIPTQLYVSKNDRPEHTKRDRVFETKLKKKDGSTIYVEISSRVVYKNGKPAFFEGIVRDITERKKVEEQLKFLSFHDKLTGLYNRAYFEEELKRLDSERQLPLSIIMADVNGLKLTNDVFGHKEGDILLCKCARIFEKCFRKEDIIARWGGDEFVMLLSKTAEQEAINIMNRINEECSKSDGQKIPISISMGCSTKTEPFKDINEVIIEAEEWMYQRKLNESRSISSTIIASLKRILFEKSIETEEHTDRTNALALQLGRCLNLSENELSELSLLSTLHDIGKVAIPEEILLKQGKLSKSEWKLIKKHSEIGYNITRSSPHLGQVANAILSHHEWWDGSGYPQGLKGIKIPIISRILAIVDAYDVMINGRPYKNKMNQKEVIKELKRCAGKQFDPDIVKKFLYILQNNILKKNPI